MNIRLNTAQTLDGRQYVTGQTLIVDDDTGAALVASGDAEHLPDGAPGCFVSEQQFDAP